MNTLSNCNIDWNATGAMIGGIGTWVASFLAAIVALILHKQTIKIGKEQNKQMEKEIKISLYDKRYKVYECFIKYYSNFKTEAKPSIELDRKTKDWALIRGLVFGRISDVKWQDDLKKMLNERNKKKQAAQLLDMFFYDKDQFNDNMKIIKMSKFCYSKEISDSLISWIDALEIVLFKPSMYSDAEEDYALLIKLTNDIKSNDIISKMEDMLKVTYTDLYM